VKELEDENKELIGSLEELNKEMKELESEK